MNRLRNTVVTVFIIISAYWLLQKMKIIPSFRNILSAKPVVIDETPILIKSIKSIGQLVTYSFFDEVVADSVIVTSQASFVNAFNRLAPVPLLPAADKRLVVIGRGKVLAGTDLSILTDSSIIIKNDTLTFFLPKAQILENILNPGDFETFIEEGDWTGQEVTLVKLKARRKMEERALQQHILDKAQIKSKSIMENFLRNMGYKNINVF